MLTHFPRCLLPPSTYSHPIHHVTRAVLRWGQQTQVLCMTLFIWMVFSTRAIDNFISMDSKFIVYVAALHDCVYGYVFCA
jgi:hypothetical protein